MQPVLERLERVESASLLYRQLVRERFSFNWHVHPEVELTYIESGQGERLVGDSVEPFGDGDLVLIGPHVPHTWASRGETVGLSKAVVIQFRIEALGGGVLEAEECRPLRHLLNRADQGLHFAGPTARQVGGVMVAMQPQDPLDQLLSLLSLLHVLSRHEGDPLSTQLKPLEVSAVQSERVERVLQWLEPRLYEPVTVAEAAKVAHLSESAFSRFFRQATGHSLIEWIHRRRVGRVCQMLGQSDALVTDIALDCGFNNLSHFHRVFREIKGMSPAQYRRRMTARGG